MADPTEPAAIVHGDKVMVVSPEGIRGSVPRDKLAKALANGYKLESSAATAKADAASEYGNQGGTAFAQGAARTLTLGGSDVFLDALGQGEDAKQIREHNEGAALAGEVGAALVPGGLVGKAGKAAGGAAAARLGTGTVGARVAGSAASAAGEGALFGAGQGVSELALSEDPLTAERAVSTIGSGALYGAAFGGAVGGAGGLLAEAGRSAKAAWGARAAAKVDNAAPVGAADEFADLAVMDAPTLRKAKQAETEAMRTSRADGLKATRTEREAERAAIREGRKAEIAAGKVEREAEVARIKAQKAEDAKGIFDETTDYKDWLKGQFFKSQDGEASKVLGKTRVTLGRTLDDPLSLAERPDAVRKVLRVQAHRLEQVAAEEAAAAAKLAVERGPRMAKVDEMMAAGEARAAVHGRRPVVMLEGADVLEDYAMFQASRSGSKPSKLGTGQSRSKAVIDIEEAGRFRSWMETAGAPETATAEALARNQALQAKLNDLAAPPASPRLAELDAAAAAPWAESSAKLSAIEARLDELGGSSTPSRRLQAIEAKLEELRAPPGMLAEAGGAIAAAAVGGLLGGLPGMAAFGPVKDLVAGKLRNLIQGGSGKASATIRKAADKFISGSAKAARGARKVSPVLSTAVLSQASFAPPGVAPKPAAGRSKLSAAYAAREAELRGMVARGIDGELAMAPGARAELHERLAGLWAMAPKLADMIETAAARRVVFLASKLAPRPTSRAVPMGPDSWQPPAMLQRKFARYVEAVERPDAILERFGEGDMTPEDAEVLREVYPETWGEMRGAVLERLPKLRQRLPFRQRLMMSMMFDAPVDSSMDPFAFSVLQGNAAASTKAANAAAEPVKAPGKLSAPEPTRGQALGA